MKEFIITLAIFLFSISYSYSQSKIDSTNNIKSRFGVGYGIVAGAFESDAPIRNSLSFHIRFTLKPISKYWFLEFALNKFPENVKHQDHRNDVSSTNVSISPLFGNCDNSGRVFFYLGPSVDFQYYSNGGLALGIGYGATSRVDYSFTKMVAAGINVKYLYVSSNPPLNYLLANINMSFTL